MAQLDVFAFEFPDESTSSAAYQAVMKLIGGGSAYRLHAPGGKLPPTLVVFAISNTAQLKAACREAGGIVTSVDPQLLRDLAERSLQAAQRGIVGIGTMSQGRQQTSHCRLARTTTRRVTIEH